jgi:hypothetical protein
LRLQTSLVEILHHYSCEPRSIWPERVDINSMAGLLENKAIRQTQL